MKSQREIGLEGEVVRLERKLSDAADCVHEAWEAFQNAGVMSQHDGRTGNDKLDQCASKLDEAAMVTRVFRSQKVEGA